MGFSVNFPGPVPGNDPDCDRGYPWTALPGNCGGNGPVPCRDFPWPIFCVWAPCPQPPKCGPGIPRQDPVPGGPPVFPSPAEAPHGRPDCGEEQTPLGPLVPPNTPLPDLVTGNLMVDPEIRLRAKKMDVAISFHYNSGQDDNEEYGRAWSSSARCYVVSSTSTNRVTLIRGNFRQMGFNKVGTAAGITTYQAVTNSGAIASLTFDGTKFVEHFPNGYDVTYQAQVGGGNPVKHELTKVQDADGVAHTYTYGSAPEAGLLKSIQVPGGRLVTFLYAASTGTSLLQTVQDWSGRRWTLQFDSNRCLTTFMTPLGCTTKYGYTAVGAGVASLISTIDDPQGYRTTYGHTSGKITKITAGSGVWTFTYDPDIVPPTWATMEAPTGAVTTYNLDTQGLLWSMERPEGYIVTFGYVNRIRVFAEVPAGWLYSLTYDQTKWVITAAEDALNNRTTLEYDSFANLTTLTDAESKVSTFGYDGTGSTRRLIRWTDPLGRVSSYTHNSDGTLASYQDPRGNRNTYSYDSQGNLVTLLAADGTISTLGYDSLNRLTSATDPLGRVMTLGYDDGDNLTSIINPATERATHIYDGCLLVASVDPLGNRTSVTYGRFSRPATLKDALGRVTSYSFDNMGFPESVEDAHGKRVTLVLNSSRQVTAVIDQLNNRTSFTYDGSGRPETLKNARGNISLLVYNARSDVIAVVEPTGDRTSYTHDKMRRLVEERDALGRRWSLVWDAAGQLSAFIDPAGRRTTQQFDGAGNLTTVIDAKGAVFSAVYQSNSNRLEATVDALGNRTTFSHDNAGQLTAIRDPRGNRWSFTHDSAGRLETRKDPLSNVTTFQFDAAGRNDVLIDAKGNRRTVTFDAVGKPVTIHYADGTRVTLQYDSLDRLTTMVDWGGTTTLAYSDRSELVGQTVPGGYRITMSYDSVGNREVLIDPDGGRFTATWDSQDRIATLRDPDNNVTTFQYNAASERTTIIDACGATRKYQYDSAGRLTTQVELNAAGNPIITLVDSYDDAGNRTGRTRDGVATTWTYDNAYRLTGQQTSGGWATFTYDGAGNMTLKSQQGSNPMTMAYDAANRITTIAQGTGAGSLTTVTFDANGNLTVEQVDSSRTSYVYDHENRLINVLFANGTRSTYTHDGLGLRRSAFEAGGSLTSIIWDGAQYLMEKAASATARYVSAEGELLAEKRGGSRFWYVPDPLASVIAMLDSTQSQPDTRHYWPYGEVRTQTGSSASPFRYLGAEQAHRDSDARTYLEADDLSTRLGGWITAPDPMELPEYAYRLNANNPLTQAEFMAWAPQRARRQRRPKPKPHHKPVPRYPGELPEEVVYRLAIEWVNEEVYRRRFGGDPFPCDWFVGRVIGGAYDVWFQPNSVRLQWNYVARRPGEYETGKVAKGGTNLMVGDMLFFDTDSSETGDQHIGIYMGGGMTISASIGDRPPQWRKFTSSYKVYARRRKAPGERPPWWVLLALIFPYPVRGERPRR